MVDHSRIIVIQEPLYRTWCHIRLPYSTMHILQWDCFPCTHCEYDAEMIYCSALLTATFFFLTYVILVWAGSYGGHDGLHDLLPQSLWIPQGKTHWRTDETAVKQWLVIEKPLVQIINKYLYGSSVFNFSHLRKKSWSLFFFSLSGQTGGVFSLQNGQYKQENTRGLWFSLLWRGYIRLS